jgi:transcriptional regulator of heat shock response
MKSVATVFNFCLLFAVIGIGLTATYFSSGSTSPTVAQRILAFVVAGLFPIVFYYDFVRRALKRPATPVTESNIDSIYYLGFLITLITLVASVIAYGIVGFGNAKNPSETVTFIATGFGLSLFATGFALWGRVNLVQRREERLGSQDPKEVANDSLFQLEEASRRLTAALNEASSRFDERLTATNASLSGDISEMIAETRTSLAKFVQQASADVTSSQRDMAQQSASCVATMSANNETLLTQLRGVIDQARISLRDFVKEASLEESSSALAAAIAGVTASLANTSGELSALLKSLEALGARAAGSVGDLEALSTSVRDASDSAVAMNGALSRVAANTTVLNLEPIYAGLAQLGNRLQELGATAASAERQYVSASQAAVGSMTARTDELREATERLSNAFVSVAEELAKSSTVLTEHIR